MTPHTAHPADRPSPSLWARVAAWCAVVMLVFTSVAEAGHLHRLAVRPGVAASHSFAVRNAAISHAAMAATSDGDSAASCLLCLLDGSAAPVHALRSVPVLYRDRSVSQTYSSRTVPLSVPFALSNRPPPLD